MNRKITKAVMIVAKVIRNIGEEQKEFVNILSGLSNRFQTWEVWSDFVTMFAVSISNTDEYFKCWI